MNIIIQLSIVDVVNSLNTNVLGDSWDAFAEVAVKAAAAAMVPAFAAAQT